MRKLGPSLRMSGAVTSIPRYALIACIGTTLPVYLIVRWKSWCFREDISTTFLAYYYYDEEFKEDEMGEARSTYEGGTKFISGFHGET